MGECGNVGVTVFSRSHSHSSQNVTGHWTLGIERLGEGDWWRLVVIGCCVFRCNILERCVNPYSTAIFTNLKPETETWNLKLETWNLKHETLNFELFHSSGGRVFYSKFVLLIEELQ